MLQLSKILVFCACAMALSSCSSTSLQMPWKAANAGEPSDHILVLGIAKNAASAKRFETEVAHQLEAKGVKAIPGFSVIRDRSNASKEDLVKIATENQVDTVLVAMVLDMRQETEVRTTVQSEGGRSHSGYYRGSGRGWYNNYSGGYTTVNQQENTYNFANIETNLYRLKSEEMIWSVMSETVSLNSGAADIKELASAIVNQLKKDGMI